MNRQDTVGETPLEKLLRIEILKDQVATLEKKKKGVMTAIGGGKQREIHETTNRKPAASIQARKSSSFHHYMEHQTLL